MKEKNKPVYSFSRLNALPPNGCLMQFVYNYIIKEEGDETAFALYGSFVHDILNRWAKGELDLYELRNEYVFKYDLCVYNPFPAKMADTYYQDGFNFFSSFEGLPNYKINNAEEHFEIDCGDFILQGYIDLELKDENENIIIHDWKSKKGFDNEEEEKQYRRQLYLYAMYIKEKYGTFPMGTQFYCFRDSNSPLKYRPFNKEEYDEAIAWMYNQANKIREIYSGYSWFWCNNVCEFGEVCKLKEQTERKG